MWLDSRPLGRYAQAPRLPRAPFVPTLPVSCTLREALKVCRGYFRGQGDGEGVCVWGAPWRHVRDTAYRRPRRTRNPPGAPGCDVFCEAPAGPHCLIALSKRVCGLESLAATLRALGSRAITDGKFSAKWLLETVA